MRIAFYAPLKAPDHPVPSGDRLMGRQIMAALGAGGHEVRLASDLRAFAREPDAGALAALKSACVEETARLLGQYTSPGGWRPQAWVTYHNYYKAPDLIGPEVAQALAIPYIGIESSFARKRRADAWAPWSAAAEFGMRRACVNFHMTRVDREGLARIVPESRLAPMPPFIDVSAFADLPRRAGGRGRAVRLVTVAMMRARAKLDSYALLAEALGECGDFDWTLTIVGDGPERARVEELFAAFAGKVRFTGELERGAVIAELCGADAMVWPGFNEAYGLVYLEAQAAGVPVVALDRPAHHDVIVPGRTGLLAGSGAEEFAAAIRSVATDADLRRRLGQAGRAFVHAERTLGDAARRFEAGLCACARGQGRRARGADFPRARAALDSIAEGGKSVPVWLRDDDAAAPTHQLDRLIETLCGRGLAVNLAVIARYATPALAERLRGEDGASVSVHGSAHTNHSGAGEKSSEYGPSRGREDVLRELAQARARIRDLFGGKALAVFVPPWNRMEPAHHAALAQTGFAAISTFGPKGETAGAGLAALPTHVDIMDWRNRCGLDAAAVDEALAGSLAHWMQAGGRAPIGLLTHHLVHDEAAWTCLEGLAQLLGGHAGARWIGLDQAVGVAQ